MGARHMTLGDFYADNGFGQASARGQVSYPEFVTHNAKLQQLYTLTAPDTPDVAMIVGQLDLARIYQEQAQYLQVAQALEQADTLLNRALLKYATGRRKWVMALIAVLAILAVAWSVRQRGRARLNAPTRRRRRRLPAPVDDLGPGLDDDDEGHDTNVDDVDGGEEDDDA